MSRRRKYAGTPSPKSTPSKSAAAEESSSSRVEPGRRRLRSARRSEPRGPAEWSPAAASGKKYETPTRMLKMDLLSCTFGSPNDPDGQNDIFWDQNSPMTKQLGKGRKKQIYTTDSDVISHIVNRIAPQDDRPTTNSMLGIWIGETAIPCTPVVVKEKSKIKISCTKLKTQHREKELMKLAKQFDKNMEELDVIQEQNKINHDFIQIISDTETLHNCKDCVQMHSPCDLVPEIDNATLKKPMEGNSWISGTNDQTSSQKPFDQNTEAAFNAMFDASTQKCSGQLSQDLPDTLLYNSNTTLGEKNVVTEASVITNETLVIGKLPWTAPMLPSKVETPTVTKPYVTPETKEQEGSHKHMAAVSTSDSEEDWESLLGNEPFGVQNTEMLELVPSGTAQVDSISRTNVSLDTRLRDSKIQDLPTNTHDQGQINAAKYRCSPNPNKKTNKLSLTRNKMKSEKSFNATVIQDKTQDDAIASDLIKIKENIHMNFTSNINASEKKCLNTKSCSEPKNKPIFKHSFNVPVNTNPFGSTTLVHETGVSYSNRTNASKLDSFFDDWNDPLFANEIIKECHKLETTWETNDVDDDLLYQACDDIERLSQQQDIKESKSTLDGRRKSRHGAESMPVLSKGGSHLEQPKHWNMGNISVQTSFLTNNSQTGKPVKMEKKEMFGNSPHILGTTTNLTMYSKNSDCEINNVHDSWSNSDVPVHVTSSKSVLSRSLVCNVNSDHASTETVTSKKSNTQRLSYTTITSGAQSNLNKTGSSSKYTFTKLKNSQVLSQLNQNCMAEYMTATKITQNIEKKKTINSWAADQQSLVKLSESLKESSKEEEEKYRKYSPEEIQRKRQEALVRRMAKSQASSVNSSPIQFL
ncbi:ewing's tumor-associated antigen 1 isoform X2 [Octodon degus]|uniref:Ewing's tumor-associated antigen 1 isoform X2 n=1 Tax=Octodon degus TaxID=10160 RepID=A0A6P6EWF2_OCTDE|nr:ewing's tumor-associated antigen 1 isoform X2 [Octodon degus]